MTRTILVTGASGVLGRALAEYLSERGAEVIGIDLADKVPGSNRFLEVSI